MNILILLYTKVGIFSSKIKKVYKKILEDKILWKTLEEIK
jgi:hypothetical protein